MTSEYFDMRINECIQLPEGETTTQGIGTEVPTLPTTTPTTTTTARQISTTPVPNIDGLCEGKTNQDIPHPKACFLYIYCYQEFEVEKMCPQYHIFDRATNT